MEHRHINTSRWSAAAIDSALERGGLKDWQELFSVVRSDPKVAELVLHVARGHDMGGASILAAALVERMRPGGLSASTAPAPGRRAPRERRGGRGP